MIVLSLVQNIALLMALAMVHQVIVNSSLLMTDVVTPEIDGRSLATILVSRLKCLFMSGYTTDAIAHHGILDEGVLFIQYPFSAEYLAAKVRAALDGNGTPAAAI